MCVILVDGADLREVRIYELRPVQFVGLEWALLVGQASTAHQVVDHHFVKNDLVGSDVLDQLWKDKEQLHLAELIILRSKHGDAVCWGLLLGFEHSHYRSDVLTLDDEVSLVSAASFAQNDEEEEEVEVGLSHQELAEQFYLVVAGFEVVERVEETQHEIVQRTVTPVFVVQFSELQQQILLQLAAIGLVLHRLPSSLHKEPFEVVKDLLNQLLNKHYLHLLSLQSTHKAQIAAHVLKLLHVVYLRDGPRSEVGLLLVGFVLFPERWEEGVRVVGGIVVEGEELLLEEHLLCRHARYYNNYIG